MNGTEITIGNNVYRTLEAQVYRNKEQLESLDIETLESLPEQFTELDGRVDDVEDDLNAAGTGIKDRLTAAEGDISSLDGRLDTVESDLNTASTGLKARVTALESGKQDKIVSSSVTLALADWDGLNVNEVTVSGVTASNIVLVTPDPADVGRYAAANIVCYAQDVDTLYFHADTLPDQDIVVNVIIIN